jgi:hypothetical protein
MAYFKVIFRQLSVKNEGSNDNLSQFYIIHTVHCHQTNIKHSTNKCTFIIIIIIVLDIIYIISNNNNKSEFFWLSVLCLTLVRLVSIPTRFIQACPEYNSEMLPFEPNCFVREFWYALCPLK